MSLGVEDWGLAAGPEDDLVVDGCSAPSLAARYGTPVHVVNEARLRGTVGRYVQTFRERYAGVVEPFYALKCNSVPELVKVILECGAKPEVMSEYEYWLARRLGTLPEDIVVNGPYKPRRFLQRLVSDRVKLIVVDSLFELEQLAEVAHHLGQAVDVLLRLNPDYRPRGMNASTAAASRKGAVFGLDQSAGEHKTAFDLCRTSPFLRYRGVHVHIGTGCRKAEDYSRAFQRFCPALVVAREEYGLETDFLDFGGGFGSPTAREYTTYEFLLYLGFGRLPAPPSPGHQSTFAEFADHICGALEEFCARHGLRLPHLILEPGRSLVSSNVLFLTSVLDVKPARRGPSWVITDGGMWTTTFPPTVEYHEIFLCRDVRAARTERYCVVGSHFFGGDYIVRNKRLPRVRAGDVLALMDSGAYFTAMESNFGHPRPPYVAVHQGQARLVRRREDCEDVLARDIQWTPSCRDR